MRQSLPFGSAPDVVQFYHQTFQLVVVTVG